MSNGIIPLKEEFMNVENVKEELPVAFAKIKETYYKHEFLQPCLDQLEEAFTRAPDSNE